MEPGPAEPPNRSIRMSPVKYSESAVRPCLQFVPPDQPPLAPGRAGGAGRRFYERKSAPHHDWPDRQDFTYILEGQIGRAAKRHVYPVPGTTITTERHPKLRSIQYESAMGQKASLML